MYTRILFFFTVAFSILTTNIANAQVSAYPYVQLSTTYTPITGGQLLGSTTSDDQSYVDPAVPLGGATTGVGLPIGFNFTYNGRVYDRFAVNTNGWISLGQSSLTPAVNVTNTYTPISSTYTSVAPLQNKIAGFARDLQGQAGSSIRYQTIGTAPNRILVIQWSNFRRFVGTGDNFNFQIRLLEANNLVQVVYGTCTATSTTAFTTQVGLRGDLNSDFNIRSTTNNWTATTAGTVNSATCTASSTIMPPSGLTFQWGLQISNDAGISALVSPAVPLVPGNQPVQVTLRNFGGNVINSANIEWSAGGVLQTPTPYTGPLAVGASTNVNLGNFNFPVTPTLYRFWSSQPNNAVDGRLNNDTLEVTLCGSLAAGTYTVGTPTSDFPTIADMMTALYSCGISGPVTMNIQAGIYNGSVRFVGQILGASAINTVTINGAGQGSTILQHNGTGVNGNATVALDAVSHVTLQNMTIRNTSNTMAWGVLFINNARFNSLLNNRIEMFYNPGVSNVYGISFQAEYASASTLGNNANFNLVQGNIISGGDKGINIIGNTTARNVGNRILNNEIFNVDDDGIFGDEQDSIEIIGNKIYNLLANTNDGIYFTDITNYIISNNKVDASTYGIYALNAGSAGTVTSRNLVTNNMVKFSATAGLYLSNVRATDIYHNTIYGAGTLTTNTCADILTPSDVNVRNNIFVNESGFVFRNSLASALASMNFNLFYQVTANTNFISFGANVYNNFTQWQSNTLGHGANDVYGDPVFVSSTDLHVDGNAANDAGDNSVAILTDIDGESRPFTGSTIVDIGADEYEPKDNDCGVINLVTPNVPLASGFQPVTVTVKNFAIQPLSYFIVQWKFNGVQQSNFSYTGAPLAPQQTVNLTLGSINFPAGLSADLEFWTILPNSQQDERTSNDTLRRFLCPGLNGNYTVGSTSSNFPTITDAINALYECGVSGPVNMNLQPGTYNGQQLVLQGNIPGASNTNRISFNGSNSSLVTLTHDGSNNNFSTVVLDDVQFITLRNMTIATTASNTSRGHGIHLINQADNVWILNNIISATWSAGIADLISIVASASLNDDFAEGNSANYLRIENNSISGGEMGIHIEGDLSPNTIKNITIKDNTISGFDDYGIFVDEADSLFIVGNRISSLTGSTLATGIYMFDGEYSVIESNNIHVRDWGIYMSSTNNPSTTGSRSKVVNNMVTSSEDDAIYAVSVAETDFYHNTFANRSTNLTGANGAYFLAPVTGTLDFKNNIFYTSSTSTTSYAFQSSVNIAQLAMNYNNYFSNAPNNLIRYGTINYTFNNWRTTNPYTYDQNSLNLNPNFVNINNGDLHIQNALLNASGDSTLSVLVDIDGNNRPSIGNTRPDIGADEIILVNNDAIAIGLTTPGLTVCENTTQAVEVEIGNSGIANINSLNVTVNVTGPVTTTLNGTYNTPLTTGQTANLNLGTINTTGGGQFCFQIITQLIGDANTSNDTVTVCRNVSIAAPVVVNDTACLNSSAFLTTNPVGGISWYDVPTGGVALSTADTFETGPVLLSTTYYAEVTACGSTRYPVIVPVVIPSPVDLGNDTTICTTGSALLSVPSDPSIISYVWSNGETTQGITTQNNGTFTVTVIDVNGCAVSDSKDVIYLPSISVSSVSNTLTCGSSGLGFVDLSISSGTSPYTYLWDNGDTTNVISGLNTGTYNVTITDANNCQYFESYLVDGPSSLSFNAVNTSSSSCGVLNDGIVNIQVVGGVFPYSYLWSNGATTEDIFNLTNGNYSVTVTDANGCETNIGTTLNIVSTVNITVDTVIDESVQLGGAATISVNGGQAPYYILWNTGLTDNTITGLVAGTYTVTVTDFNGCTSVETVVVNYTIPANIDNVQSVETLSVFPNPTNGIVNFELILNQSAVTRLDLFNISGQLLQSFEVGVNEKHNFSVDLSSYPAAVYMARLIIGDEIITTKVVLQK
jgi:hypothetical protein